MPRKSDKIPIKNENLDRRVKLCKQDKLDIVEEYSKGDISIRGLAKKYEVSRRLIQFILFPERAKKNRADREKRGGSKQYYNKDKWAKTMKEHRDYKKHLYQKGLIGKNS